MTMPATCRPPLDPAAAADLGRALTAFGDPTRQQILLLLARERLNVTALSARFALTRPAISHQLKVLTDAGLLVQERVGRERVYRVDVGRCRAFAAELCSFIDGCCGPARRRAR
jgi:DNA-binding transcriptional ArsR family regulator